MGFMTRTLHPAFDGDLLCDACGQPIGQPWLASVVVAAGEPPRFACAERCETTLLTEGAGVLALVNWLASLVHDLDFDAEDLMLVEEPEPPDAGEVVATIRALEGLLVRPGMPAGLSLSAALALGYLSPQHVAEALARARDGVAV